MRVARQTTSVTTAPVDATTATKSSAIPEVARTVLPVSRATAPPASSTHSRTTASSGRIRDITTVSSGKTRDVTTASSGKTRDIMTASSGKTL